MAEINNKIICQRSELQDGGKAARFQFEFDGRIVQAFAIAYAGDIYAYANSCPHRGTELDWQHGEVFDESGLYLVCATHGAIFEPDSGRCVGGPCQGQSLVRLAVETTNMSVELRVGRLLAAQSPQARD
jgi:nitrite reductase/ring-hydroxylating ferredoxin subunit